VSQRVFLEVERRQGREQGLAVRIRFSDGSVYDQTGKINFVDVTVNQATDTIVVRATFPNPQGKLIDGQLVRVIVESDKPEAKLLIPQSALIADQQGIYVFVVEDGKAVIRRVKPGGQSGAYAIVDDGLKAGDQVIVQGMETLRAGTPVLATPAPPPPAGG
jgi:membrane fusion protein (multidrug efflux system)